MQNTKTQKIIVSASSMLVLTVTMILTFKFPKFAILWNGTAYFIGIITWYFNEWINYNETLNDIYENWEDADTFSNAQLSCIGFKVNDCDLVAVYSPDLISQSEVEKSISEQTFDERIILMTSPQYQKWLAEIQENTDIQITTRKRGD